MMVWLIRVLIIGTISLAGENLFSLAEDRPRMQQTSRPFPEPARANNPAYVRPPTPKPISAASSQRAERVEPTYHPVGMNAQTYDERRTGFRK